MHKTVKQFYGHVASYLPHYYHQIIIIIIITIENKNTTYIHSELDQIISTSIPIDEYGQCVFRSRE